MRPQLPILVAFSGASDSLALLALLKELEQRDGCCIVHAGHVVHHMQEADAQGREIAVVDLLCKKLQVPLFRKEIPAQNTQQLSLDPSFQQNAEGNVYSTSAGMDSSASRPKEHTAASSKLSGGGKNRYNEHLARKLRYAQLYQIAKEQEIAVLATAHHRDDQWETVLMRLLRAEGLRGLAGIAELRDFRFEGNGETRVGLLIRPLLAASKKQLQDIALSTLKSLNIPDMYHHDPNNDTKEVFRNNLRNTVAPVLSPLVPDFRNSLIRFSQEMRGMLVDSGYRNYGTHCTNWKARTVYPWFCSEGRIELPRSFFESRSVLQRLHLLYLGANFLGLQRVPKQCFAPLLQQKLPHTSIVDAQNLRLQLSPNMIQWGRKLETTEKKVTGSGDIAVLNHDMECIFEQETWSIRRCNRDSMKKKAAIYRRFSYSGLLRLTKLQKSDTMQIQETTLNIKDMLQYEGWKNCPVVQDSCGVLLVPAECFLKRTLMRDDWVETQEKDSSNLRNVNEKSNVHRCTVGIAYKFLQFSFR